MELASERLIIRPFQAEDWKQVHRYASDPEVVQHVIWGPNTEEQTRTFVAEQMDRSPEEGYGFAICLKETGELIGGCNIDIVSQTWRKGEIGYCLSREHWGKGYATEAARLLIRFGFESLKLHRIHATCDPGNIGSKRTLEKCGMKQEGYLREDRLIRGRWRDSLLFSILEQEH